MPHPLFAFPSPRFSTQPPSASYKTTNWEYKNTHRRSHRRVTREGGLATGPQPLVQPVSTLSQSRPQTNGRPPAAGPSIKPTKRGECVPCASIELQGATLPARGTRNKNAMTQTPGAPEGSRPFSRLPQRLAELATSTSLIDEGTDLNTSTTATNLHSPPRVFFSFSFSGARCRPTVHVTSTH